MLPAQRNKVDISKLTPQEQQAFRLYGKLPSRSVNKVQERKYFDSGDYALAKAGKQKDYGKEIPTPDAIPHASPSPMVGSVGSTASSSGSPPTSTPLSALGSPPVAGAIPLPGAGSGGATSDFAAAAGSGAGGDANLNLSMSPGRVGVGQTQLATSPTRSFGSFPIAHSHAHNTGHSSSPINAIHGSSGLAGRDTDAMGATTSAQGGQTNNPMVAATTGNQIGKTHIRRSSQSEGNGSLAGTASPPPTSGLSNSITASEHTEDEQVAGMDLQ